MKLPTLKLPALPQLPPPPQGESGAVVLPIGVVVWATVWLQSDSLALAVIAGLVGIGGLALGIGWLTWERAGEPDGSPLDAFTAERRAHSARFATPVELAKAGLTDEI